MIGFRNVLPPKGDENFYQGVFFAVLFRLEMYYPERGREPFVLLDSVADLLVKKCIAPEGDDDSCLFSFIVIMKQLRNIFPCKGTTNI